MTAVELKTNNTMTQQTAMQEMIQRLESLSSKYQNAGLLTAIEIANQLLEKEKEQMKGMYTEGGFAQMRYFDGREFITAEQYYNETYKNK